MSGRRRGFTLVELLVVLVIFSLALGLAVTLFRSANQDLGVRAATNRVVSILRGAGDQARDDALPAQVVFDVTERRVYALTQETAGMWHFEDERGAFGRVATLHKVTGVPGIFGGAYAFGPSSAVDCGPIPVNTPDAGIVIDLYVRRPARAARSATRKPQIICSLGSDVMLTMETDGRIEGAVGSKRVTSGTEKLRIDEWERLTLDYSTLDLRLFINGREVGVATGAAPWSSTRPFVVGATAEGFIGVIDEVRVSLVLPHDPYELPSEAAFEVPQDVVLINKRWFVVWFDGEGRLDSRKHAGPVTVTIKSPTDRKAVGVQSSGVVTR